MHADLLRGDKVAAALMQLAGFALAICAAAQQSLVVQLELAMAELSQATKPSATAPMAAAAAVIDLTADDSNDSHGVDTEPHGECQLSENQGDRCSLKKHDSLQAALKPDLTAAREADSVQTARHIVSEAAESNDAQPAISMLVAISCDTLATRCRPASHIASHETSHSLADANLVERVQQSTEASSSGRGADYMPLPSSCETCTNQQLMDAEEMADMCMLCAYGMDLAALTPRALQSVEHWSGTTCLPTSETH